MALVLSRYGAAAGAPPGVDAQRFAAACLADTYEVLADLVGVTSGVVGPPSLSDLLWPGALHLPEELGVREVAARVGTSFDELVLVPADAPDLPGLVLAKMFKVLHRVDLTVAPERGGPGMVALGLALPLADWVPDEALDLDRLDWPALLARAPQRSRGALSPDWHRLRTADAIRRLDPRLEGWEETRALLEGRARG
ncbi:MAG: hypothetical protein JWP61_272 [Friedmanniella sp.]|nr:hypothetical protein [Friedmanniella sp.]